jgi:tRNA-specific 2-thiouridylase
MSKKIRVVVGMSGGVDSSVTAYLMQQQGYEVIGLYMRNWHDDSVTINNECPWVDDSNDALIVAQQLGIPFQTIDLSEAYRKRIVDYMFDEYERGRTPNPDVLCNREIKFDIFLKTALSLGADFVATGHYCRKESFEKDGKTIYQLLAGKDPNKDQSYFLCQLTQEQLKYALFPIGDLLKPQVRAIAEESGLATAAKKDSQGLCFVGKVRLPDFLQQQLKAKHGKVVEIPTDSPLFEPYSYQFDAVNTDDELKSLTKTYHYQLSDGKVVGDHRGAHFFTVGQRKGLGIGGYVDPLFIIATDTTENLIFVGEGELHPGLNRPGLLIPKEDVHWIREDLKLLPGERAVYKVRIRYRQPLEEAVLYCRNEGIYIIFNHLQKGIAAGQFAAWYLNDELIGSGVIG